MVSVLTVKNLQVTICCFACLLTSWSLSEAILCKGSAKYKLIFKGEWTRTSHPEDFPARNSPHFSRVVGCSHNSSYVMWKPGMKATLGVKDVAERGDNRAINREMDEQISSRTALAKFQGSTIANTGSTTVSNIQVNSQYPLVSVISMIAPSPDWFVGVHDYSLCNETTGEWFDKRVKDLLLYDSGTDSALTFVHSNKPTVPPEPIFLINNTQEGSLKSNNTIKRFGTFTFEKTFDSNSQFLSTPHPSIKVTATEPSTKGVQSTVTVITPSDKPSSSTTRSGGCLVVYLIVSVFLKFII